jgi:hypothetical protein
MGLLYDASQGASRDAWAGLLGSPVDLATLIRNTGRAAYGTAGRATGLLSAQDMPELAGPQPGGSESIAAWMRKNGLLADNPGSTGDTIGSLASFAAPLLAGAKAPQIAGLLGKAGENLAAPRTLGTQRGIMDLNSLDDLMKGPAERTGIQLGGSGDSAASLEAANRLASDAARGRVTMLVKADGTQVPLKTVDAPDWVPGPGEVVWQKGIGDDPEKWIALSQGKGATKSRPPIGESGATWGLDRKPE